MPSKPDLRLSLEQARGVFLAAQGFPQRPEATVVSALEENGFVRTLGGVDVYLAVRARVPGLKPADLESVVAAEEARIVPAVRGCMYLVPRRDVPLCLRVADLLTRTRDQRDQEKAGIRPGEVEEVAQAVLPTLAEHGPLTTDALRRAMPAGTVRSLGEQGKKVGVSSPLPGALRRLEVAGQVERALDGVRLDSERYRWRLPARGPFEGAALSDDPIDLFAGMARIFFRGAGLGTIKDFAAWAGVSQRDAKAAVERTPLVPVAIEGVADVHYLLEERRDLLDRAAEAASAVAFLPFEDNVVALHGGAALLVDPAHHEISVPSWGSRRSGGTPLREARHMSLRTVVADGRVAGFWEYDPDAREVVVGPFAKLPGAVGKRVDAEAAKLAGFLSDFGHGRSFSLDTDEDLRQRSGAVRTMG